MGGGSTGVIKKICKKYEVNLLKRKRKKITQKNKYSIGVLTNPNHQMFDLKESEIKEVLKNSTNKKDYGVRARQYRSSKNGLLLLYPILIDKDVTNISNYTFGFAISFPSSSKTKSDENTVSYKVNNVYFKQEYSSNTSV